MSTYNLQGPQNLGMAAIQLLAIEWLNLVVACPMPTGHDTVWGQKAMGHSLAMPAAGSAVLVRHRAQVGLTQLCQRHGMAPVGYGSILRMFESPGCSVSQ